jgi:dihydrofolate synthase / folylpolyglutamate synthase
MKFLDFLKILNNPEKTRNFNQFLSYSLEPFSDCISHIFSNILKSENLTNHRISIVGTNGKGSLGYYLQSQLSDMGYPTGFYSSPHLMSPLERIMIQGKSISEEKIDSILARFNNKDLDYLKQFSYFEIFTLFAMIAFQNDRIEWQIYEAGLGGDWMQQNWLKRNILHSQKLDWITLQYWEIL